MTTNRPTVITPGLYALGAAVLFGASTPAAKVLLGHLSPQLVAGMLYLGSGTGLVLLWLLRRSFSRHQQAHGLKAGELLWLAGAIATGGIAAPLLLMIGLSATQATAASLLLNLEGVFTALLAWLAFKEHTDKRIVWGMLSIVLGSLLLSWTPGQSLAFSMGSLSIIAACGCWAMDNNLTRKISDADPVQIAAIKGLVAGIVNCSIALGTGSSLPPFTVALSAGVIGFLGYGISLTLFIKSLSLLGTARTGAYFSTAPFAGAILSLLFLHESMTVNLVIAAVLMILGVVLHLTEKHDHEHLHLAVEHDHMHVHDAHHMHEHESDAPTGEPHSHPHLHSEQRHSHPHYPDSEHRHEHY